jgi:hypothetical protein
MSYVPCKIHIDEDTSNTNKATKMSADEEVYILNADSPRVAHFQFYWFLSLLQSGVDTQCVKYETEVFFRERKNYHVPILMDISKARSRAMIARPYSIAARQMFETNNTSERIFCIYNVRSEDDASREASYYSGVDDIRPGSIIVSMKE